MGHVWRFLVWLPSAISAGIAFMMGTDPDQAVTNLSKWYGKIAPPPEWMQAPSTAAYDLAMWALAIMSVLFFVLAVYVTWWKGQGRQPREPGDQFFPMKEAARLAYESVEQRLLGRLARGSRRGPLAFMAEKLFFAVPIVMGTRPPSTQLLPVSDVAAAGLPFSQDGGSLLKVDGTPAYTDLRVDRAHFDEALVAIQDRADGSLAGSSEEMIPLREAVGRALEATRDTALAASYLGYGSDEKQLVFGYFSAMLDRNTPIYGKTPPATDWIRLGRVDLSQETLWEMKAIKPHHKPIRVTALSLLASDLEHFIAAVKASG